MNAAESRVVFWEDDPTRTRTVVRGCLRCYPLQDLDEESVVSPAGIAHVGVDYGFTACGFDATGPDWWWRT